jgi:hypothetical protein
MQHLPGKRVFALVFGLAAATVGSAYAQDTTETGQAPVDTAAPGAGAIDTSEFDTSAVDTSAVDTSAVDTSAFDTSAVDTSAVDTAAVDTSATRDTTDTSGVQNPQGYRGMERDTTVFPDTGGPPADADAVEDQTTGTYDDTVSQEAGGADTTSVGETEPIEEDTATPRLEPSENPAAGDTAGQTPDSTP